MHIEVDYYRAFDLIREPFSSTPDPDFLYQSRQHFGTLQQLENSIRSETGLNLVIGAPGTGKTTLFRHLCRKLSDEKNIILYTLTGKPYDDISQFEEDILSAFGLSESSASTFETPHEMVHRFLIRCVEEEQKAVAFLIDDGHLIPEHCFDALSRLAGYESDGKKLLRIVIFAGSGFMDTLSGKADVESSVKVYRTLGPLSFNDTRNMIGYRLKIAGNTIKQAPVFTYPGLLAIYLATGGYPRKIVNLCHRCIVSMIVNNSMRSGWFHVRSNAQRILSGGRLLPEYIATAAVLLVPFLAIAYFTGTTYHPDTLVQTSPKAVVSVVPPVEHTHADENTMTDELESVAVTQAREENDSILISMGESAIIVDSGKDEGETTDQMTKDTFPSLPVVPPDVIGAVEIKRGDTLLVLLEIVYGHSRQRYSKPVIDYNHHIADINALEIGDRIEFPPIIAEIDEDNWKKELFWVRLFSSNTLESAVEFYRAWPDGAPRVKVIPYFTGSGELVFDVIVKGTFTDRNTAEARVRDLSGGTVDVEVIQFKPDSAVYYSNPFY